MIIRPFTLLVLGFVVSSSPNDVFASEDKFISSASQQLRFREADSYKNNKEQRNIIVGVVEFGKKEQRRIFGDKIGDYVTLDVGITNNSPYRVSINEFQVRSSKGDAPLPDLHKIVKEVDPGDGKKGNMRMSILRRSLAEKSLQNVIVEPNQTVQGVIFIDEDDYKKKAELFVRIQNLSRLAYLEYSIPVKAK